MVSSLLLGLSVLLSASVFWSFDARLGWASLALPLFFFFWRFSDRLAGVDPGDVQHRSLFYNVQKFIVSFGVALLYYFIVDNWGRGW